MTYREWEWDLKNLLRDLPQKEVRRVIEYYKEIYGDKKEAGFSDRDILIEFGTPEECAENIRTESGTYTSAEKTLSSPRWGGKILNDLLSKFPTINSASLKTFLILLPLAMVAFSIVVIFALCCIAGCAADIGGAVVVIYGIIQMFSGMGFGAAMAIVGMGMAIIGVSTVMALLFLMLTKYTVIRSYNALSRIYTDRKEN